MKSAAVRKPKTFSPSLQLSHFSRHQFRRPRGGRPRLSRTRLSDWRFVRAPQRHSLADAAEKSGLRLWHDLLAAFARLAAGRNWDVIHFLVELAFAPRPDRLFAGGCRQLFNESGFWGQHTGPSPTIELRVSSNGSVHIVHNLSSRKSHQNTRPAGRRLTLRSGSPHRSSGCETRRKRTRCSRLP